MCLLVILATCRVPAAMDAASENSGSVMATTTAVITATSRTAKATLLSQVRSYVCQANRLNTTRLALNPVYAGNR